jgi:membrane-bound lytic murein transglycosylase D
MQLIINVSKIIILAFLSCILLVAWNENHPIVIELPITEVTRPASVIRKPVDTIWHHMRQEFKLNNNLQSIPVKREIRKLLADQNKLYNILKAAGPYMYFIHKQIQSRGLPGEIALIPVIESEFNPNDHSKKGALGLWQLMSGTAQELGVKIKSGYDGRRNIIASTHAALTYFTDLGRYFNGNWYLAIAAYNSGQVKVKSAMQRTRSNNFWNLPLPNETKQYVPKLLAVAAIVKDPNKYGIQLPNITNQPFFSEIRIKKSINLAQAAKLFDVNIKLLHILNPDYRQGNSPTKTIQTLLVPIDKAYSVNYHVPKNRLISTQSSYDVCFLLQRNMTNSRKYGYPVRGYSTSCHGGTHRPIL